MAAKKKKKKAGAAKKRGGGAREVLCVGSKVKGYIKSKSMKCSGELLGELSNRIHDMLDGAITRCKGNKRSTVRPHDL